MNPQQVYRYFLRDRLRDVIRFNERDSELSESSSKDTMRPLQKYQGYLKDKRRNHATPESRLTTALPLQERELAVNFAANFSNERMKHRKVFGGGEDADEGNDAGVK